MRRGWYIVMVPGLFAAAGMFWAGKAALATPAKAPVAAVDSCSLCDATTKVCELCGDAGCPVGQYCANCCCPDCPFCPICCPDCCPDCCQDCTAGPSCQNHGAAGSSCCRGPIK